MNVTTAVFQWDLFYDIVQVKMPLQLQLVVLVSMPGLLVAVIRAAMWVPAIVINTATQLVTAVVTQKTQDAFQPVVVRAKNIKLY